MKYRLTEILYCLDNIIENMPKDVNPYDVWIELNRGENNSIDVHAWQDPSAYAPTCKR